MVEGTILCPPSFVLGARNIVIRVVSRSGKAVAEGWRDGAWEETDDRFVAETLPGKGDRLTASELEAWGIPFEEKGSVTAA